MGQLDGKIAVITGGARGMGAATARLFAREGARVVVADILPEAQAVAAEIGNSALYLPLDVSDEQAWLALEANTSSHFGSADILVNNAGVLCVGALVDLELAAFERALRINLCGVFLGIKTMAPGMIAKGAGAIINISSTEGLRGANGLGGYTASKWGVRGLTKVAAMELSHRGVRVNSVYPGPVDTPMGNPQGLSRTEQGAMHARLPIGRVGSPEEIAAVSLFLASDAASFMCGAELAADGGMTIGDYLGFLPGAPAALTVAQVAEPVAND